jgi:hypothetical protein
LVSGLWSELICDCSGLADVANRPMVPVERQSDVARKEQSSRPKAEPPL